MPNYYDPSQFEFLNVFVEHWNDIQKEYISVAHLAEKWPPSVVKGTEHDGTSRKPDNNNNGLWNVVPLYFNDTYYNADNCVVTTKLLDNVPNLILSGFSVLEPGCEIYPHTGPTEVYRCHLGIICDGKAWFSVNNEKYVWKEKEWMIFNDINEHQASNPSHMRRVVLIVDFIK